MNLHELIKLLRSRWITICATALTTMLGAIVYTLLQTPEYQASTRLFVSTSSGTTASDLVSSSRYSQERVLSYAELLMGETLAQRTIDRLNLDMSADKLKSRVTAKSKLNTVLIDVSVLDESPVRARDIANSLSDEFVVMARELETSAPGASPAARVIVEQRASVPHKPVIPRKSLNLGFGLILGLLLGVGVAFLRDQLDNTVKSDETLGEIAGVGTVGYIPFDKSIQTSPAIPFDTSNSGTAEAFRKLRTNLRFLAVDNPPKMIVVTSSSPSEGKSTTSVNLALALAEAGHNVILVDGDLRRPRLHNYLNILGSVGFSTVLSGGATLSEVIQETKFPRLTFLAAGPTPPNPSELLGSLAAEKLLSDLRAQFDYVIVDSSPLLAVTDGAILATQADGAIVTARFGKTKREELAHTVGVLHDVGATLLGAVLTMIPPRGSGSYSYTSHYGYTDSNGPMEPPSRQVMAEPASSDRGPEKPRRPQSR